MTGSRLDGSMLEALQSLTVSACGILYGWRLDGSMIKALNRGSCITGLKVTGVVRCPLYELEVTG